MRRLTLFAKGNIDVRDALHGVRANGITAWNGINEVVRPAFPDLTVRVRHETWTRSDALLEATGHRPPDLRDDVDLGPYPADAQFSRAVFDDRADAVVLSIQPDIMTQLVRHRHQGYALYPYAWRSWAPEQREWLRRHFEPLGLLDVDTSMDNIEQIKARLDAQGRAMTILNMSTVVPGERIVDYRGCAETLSTRIKRFNLGLVDLSERTGLPIVDVDARVARMGADRVKIDALHLTAEGCRVIAEEVLQVLVELGHLTKPAASPCA